MFQNRFTIKDDKSPYAIYHMPYEGYVPRIGNDIPIEGCQIVSIDIGIKNFAIRIETRFATGIIKTEYMNKINFIEYVNKEDIKEKNTVGAFNPVIYILCTQLLDSIFAMLHNSKIVMIERQMVANYRSTRMMQHVLTYFMIHAPTFKYPCIVIDIDSHLKGSVLNAPKGITEKQLKRWSVQKAIELCTIRKDEEMIKLLTTKMKKGKMDDLADTIVQIEALFIYIGGIKTTSVN